MQKLTKELIRNYLAKYNLMQVATQGKDHPWIASVYYTFDNDLNLYFLSDPRTKHCRQIANNPKVAVAVTDSDQDISKFKRGLQIYGLAKQIKSANKIKHALKLWKAYLKVKNPELSYENMLKKIIKGKMYQISPKKIKFFNQELFKVEDGKEPILEFD